MTDLIIPRGDSANYAVVILDTDAVTPLNITEAILRFGVKASIYDSNTNAVMLKQSYYPEELEITDAINGAATVKVLVSDTLEETPGTYYWDLDVTKKGVLVTGVGTFTATTGSPILAASHIDFNLLKVGQVIDLSSLIPSNNLLVDIVSFDATAQTITVGYNGFLNQIGIAQDIYEGDRKTPTGLSGTFSIGPDIID